MDNFHILAFETSGSLCSIALLSHTGGETRVHSAEHEGRQAHAEHILPLADGLLVQAGVRRADLAAVAFGQGPGGFTGLRVACGVAQGLALALDIPVVPVDSLCAIAMRQAGRDRAGVHVVLQDARMNEVYAAAYRWKADQWVTLQAPVLLARSDVSSWVEQFSAEWGMQAGGAWWFHGDAGAAYVGLEDELTGLGGIQASMGEGPVHAHAESVALSAAEAWCRGQTLDAAMAAPAYVRDKVAYTSLERAAGLGGNPQVHAAGRTLHVMRPADLDEVVAIERQVESFPWSLRNFADALTVGHHGWVIRQMGGMLGFALVMDAPDVAHLLLIGVRPDMQRQGTGTLLLEQCIAHCRRAGLPALTLEVRHSNGGAIAFYQKHGFHSRGVRRGYYPAAHQRREDAWIMTLDLGERP